MSSPLCAPNLRFERLKLELGPQVVSPERVTPPEGLSTGWPALDRFLLWHGFPKGALSLMVCEAGGATSLWQQSAAAVTKKGQWAAWMNGPEQSLTPWSLKRRGVDLSKLLCVSAPADTRQTLWALQELMSLSLFELIGCDLGEHHLREHQILKLKKLAMRYQTAVVFFVAGAANRRLTSRSGGGRCDFSSAGTLKSSFYSLILKFQRDSVMVDRALHRPTPHLLERKDLYADTLPQLHAGRRALCG